MQHSHISGLPRPGCAMIWARGLVLAAGLVLLAGCEPGEVNQADYERHQANRDSYLYQGL